MKMTIAIDGPSGAGKSTIARRVSEEMGIAYLDTGAMYRALGLKALRSGVNLKNEAATQRMLENTRLDVRYHMGEQQMVLDGEDVSQLIRTQEVSDAAAAVSKWPGVRKALVAQQRAIAGSTSCVMDGRDIGTVVLPDASLKVFLTADVRERAKRRHLELAEKGQSADFEQVLSEMMRRDESDATRSQSPLMPAEDAMVIDATYMTAEQVAQRVLCAARKIEAGDLDGK